MLPPLVEIVALIFSFSITTNSSLPAVAALNTLLVSSLTILESLF